MNTIDATFFTGQTWLIYDVRSTATRAQIKAEIAARDGVLLKSVTRKLRFMVWGQDTKLPGDTVPGSKASKLLAQGGIVFSVEDFNGLLQGNVPTAVSKHLAAAPKPAPTSPKASKPAKTTAKTPKKVDQSALRDTLVARCCAAFALIADQRLSTTDWMRLDVAEATIEAAIDAGHIDSAQTMAKALPDNLQATSLWRIAKARQEELAAPRKAVLDAIESSDDTQRSLNDAPTHRAVMAAKAMALGDAALNGAAEAIIDAVLDGQRPISDMLAIIEALRTAGDHDQTSAILERWRLAAPDSLGATMSGNSSHQGLLTFFCDRPAVALELLNALEARSRNNAADHTTMERIAASWTGAQITAFMEAYYERWNELAQPMKRAGRAQEHTQLTLDALLQPNKTRWKGYEATQLRAIDPDAIDTVREFMATKMSLDHDPVNQAALHVRTGQTTLSDAASLLGHRRADDQSVMSAIQDLVGLIRHTLGWGFSMASYAPVFEQIDRLLALNFRTSYDRGVEATTRSSVNNIRADVLLQDGDRAALKAALKSDLTGLKSLQTHCKNTYAKNEAARSLVQRALKAGFPDIALKAARKISKRDRRDHASRVAAGTVSQSITAALAAFDSLAGKDVDASWFLHGAWLVTPPLPVRLWRALA